MSDLKQWLTPPIFAEDEVKTSTARHLHVMTWLSFVMLTAYAVALPIGALQLARRVVFLAPLLIMQVMVLEWVRRGRVMLASLVSLSGFWVMIAVFTFISGGVRSAPFAGNVLIVLTAAILLGRQAAFGFAALSVLEGVALVWAELAGPLRVPPLSTTPVSALLLQTVYIVVGTASLQFATLSIKEALERVRHELSERRRVEEKYRNMVENAVEGIFQSTPDGRFLSVNPAMARMYGYASSQEMVQSVTDIRRQIYADADQRAQLVQRLEMDSLVQGFEMQDRRKDGSLFWTSMNVRTVRDERGRTLYYEGMLEDVSERKRVEEALRISEDKFSKAFRSSPDIISISSLRDGRFVEINEGFEKLLGYGRDEVIGRTALELNTWRRPEDRRVTLASLETQRQIRGQEVVYRAKDGRLVTCLLSAEIIDLNGEPHLLAVSRDITERKQAEEQVHRLNQDLQQELAERKHAEQIAQHRADETALLYNMSIALSTGEELYQVLRSLLDYIQQLFDLNSFYVGIYDEKNDLLQLPLVWNEGEFLHVEPRNLRVTPGLAGEVIFGRRRIYHGDLEDPQAPPATRLAANASSCNRSFVGIPLIIQDRVIGMFSLQSKQANAYTPEQIHLLEALAAQVAIAIDKARLLDQLKLQLAERQRLVTELEAKNAELERFTYTVSHDLKAPLITIRGFLGFVEKDALAGNIERVRADMTRIVEATDKMQRLLNELLELSRIGRMVNPPQAAPFEAIVREALELVRGRIQACSAQVLVAPQLPTVYGDRARLVEVVQNLVDNAAKFMGNQSNPWVEIGQRGADLDGKPIFFVRDDGMGIAPQYHERVFGLFNKLDAQSEGTGVGLALVKRIVEVHGGRIWVESKGLGHGTTFCFTLPAVPAGARVQDSPASGDDQ